MLFYTAEKEKEVLGVGFMELLLIAVGLSMDAFAVSVCKGLGMRRTNWKHALVIALFFGGFQAVMPLLGWALGRQFEHYITAYDHWIAFALLAIIGGKMIWEALRGGDEEDTCGDETLNLKELLGLAVATSIDALAVGVTFAFLQVQILPSITLIGVTTFALSLLGVAIGRKFGTWMMQKAQVAGGIVLVLIGVKILLEHLNILG